MTFSLRFSDAPTTKRRRGARIVLASLVALLALPALPQVAGAQQPWDKVLDITFPTDRDVRISNDYTAARSGGRMHCATDLIGRKHQNIYAARGGRITFMPTSKPSYGYTMNIEGDDGRRYSYLHLNDDVPGTQTDNAGPEHAYAPGLKVGSTVRRGQLIGYMGDSGNAEGGVDHLHFEIHDPNSNNPACGSSTRRVNPFFSLYDAASRGDYGGNPTNPPSPPARAIDDSCPTSRVTAAAFNDVSGTHAPAINCIAWWRIALGDGGRFSPNTGITREQMASLIVRTFDNMGKPLPAATTDHFVDDQTSIHADAINRIAQVGIVSGTSPGRFSPGKSLSRAQMATIIANSYRRAAGRDLPAGPNVFTDDNGNAHEAAINRLADKRIAVGSDAITYRPTKAVSRGEMATFLARTLDLMVEERVTSLPR